MDILGFLAEHAPKVPFILAMRRFGDDGSTVGVKLNTAKILESLIAGAIIAATTTYMIQQKMEVELASIKYMMAQDRADRISRENENRDAILREGAKLDRHIADSSRKRVQ
jgi:hypothetical protein